MGNLSDETKELNNIKFEPFLHVLGADSFEIAPLAIRLYDAGAASVPLGKHSFDMIDFDGYALVWGSVVTGPFRPAFARSATHPT